MDFRSYSEEVLAWYICDISLTRSYWQQPLEILPSAIYPHAISFSHFIIDMYVSRQSLSGLGSQCFRVLAPFPIENNLWTIVQYWSLISIRRYGLIQIFVIGSKFQTLIYKNLYQMNPKLFPVKTRPCQEKFLSSSSGCMYKRYWVMCLWFQMDYYC